MKHLPSTPGAPPEIVKLRKVILSYVVSSEADPEVSSSLYPTACVQKTLEKHKMNFNTIKLTNLTIEMVKISYLLGILITQISPLQ